ncbi:MAG: hypothetical protein ACRDTF_21480, partial [Pseudonocardiaceae bacterium]
MTVTGVGWAQALRGDVRANPVYRLRPLDSLPGEYRALLERWQVDMSGVFGFLVPERRSGLPSKLVDRAAADLFAALERPGRPPDAIAGRVAGLVLDGVLEVESVGGYVSGPLAHAAFRHDGAPRIRDGHLGRLARAALDYAARMRLGDVDALTARLYAYGRVPFSRRWARAFPGPAAVLGLLPRLTLARSWAGPVESQGSAWLSWSRRDRGAAATSSALPYKLYVSPHVAALTDALPAVIEALTRSPAPRFKIGADAAGLIRPDKIVVYLADAGQVDDAADALSRALTGVAAHGVPFSAELAADGLLSWGGDPPADAGPVGRKAESWRLSVCRRLAEGLVMAQRVPGGGDPVEFALT